MKDIMSYRDKTLTKTNKNIAFIVKVIKNAIEKE